MKTEQIKKAKRNIMSANAELKRLYNDYHEGEYHIADWNTGEDYRRFDTEKEALDWIKANCYTEDGKPWNGFEPAFYRGNRLELY